MRDTTITIWGKEFNLGDADPYLVAIARQHDDPVDQLEYQAGPGLWGDYMAPPSEWQTAMTAEIRATRSPLERVKDWVRGIFIAALP